MSINLNIVVLCGNLTRDPDNRAFAFGNICNFTVAVNDTWKDKEGVVQKRTTFVDCKAWNKQGDFVANYFAKGRAICVIGRLETESWDDKAAGAKRSKLVINVERAQFADSKPDLENQQKSPAAPEQRVAEPPTEGRILTDDSPPSSADDLPF